MKKIAGITLVTLVVISFSVSIYAQEAKWEKLNKQSQELYQQGEHLEAAKVAQDALEVAENTFGPEHQNVGLSLFVLASIYQAQGRYAEAEPLLKRSVEIREHSFGQGHPLVGKSQFTLVSVYEAQGKNAEAKALFKRALEMQEDATVLTNLAVRYHHQQGRYSEAELLYKRSLEIQEDATAMWNLAVLYHNQRKYAEAEPLYKRALEIQVKALGPDHKEVTKIRNYLEALHRAQSYQAEVKDLPKRDDSLPVMVTITVGVVVSVFILVLLTILWLVVAQFIRSEKIARTRSIMGVSSLVLKNDKKLLIFPFIDFICCILIVAAFLIPSYPEGIVWLNPEHASIGKKVHHYSALFLCLFCQYLVFVFFNSAIIACATIRMGGRDPKMSDGFRAAIARFPFVAIWASVLAGVQVVTQIIRDMDEHGAGGEIVATLLEMSWAVVSFLVVPIIVLERKGPFSALKESTSLLKKTWGENLIFNFGFGAYFFFLSIIGWFPIVAVLLVIEGVFAVPFDSVTGKIMLTTAGLSVIYIIALAVIHSSLRNVFKTALYLYTRDGEVPAGFQLEMLKTAIVPR